MTAQVIVKLDVGDEWASGMLLVSKTYPVGHQGKTLIWVQSTFNDLLAMRS